MDPSSTLQLAIDNLLSPPVLGFALGLLAVAIGGELRRVDAVYQGLSMYLLLAIGLKGGVALRESVLNEVALPALGALFAGILTLFFLNALGDLEGGNVRIETLVSHATANAIMAKLSVDWFPHYAVVAWISDVEVAREDRYL